MDNNFLLKNLIKKSFENYYKIQNKYADKNIKYIYNNEKNELVIKYNNITKKYDTEILGLFDETSNTWIWSWSIANVDMEKNKTIISKKLLNYGLDIEIKNNKEIDKTYIKSVLTTSRIHIKNYSNLQFILSLSTYLIKNKIKGFYYFSYPKNRTENIILYLLLK